MVWRDSLPARVALATAGLLAIILLAVTAASYVITALLLRQAVDSALISTLSREELDRTEQERWEREDELPFDHEALERAGRSEFVFVSLVEGKGGWAERAGPDWWQTLTPAEHEVRVLYARDRRGQVVRAVAPMESAHEVLPALLRGLALLALLGAGLSAAISWRMAGHIYAPLKAVIHVTEEISAQSLALRVPDLWHDRTLQQLTRVLNAMIGRLEAAFEARGRFVAAAAHELRGPLGAMRAELEVTLRRPRTVDEYQVALQGALVETGRLTTVAEHLLMLARGGTLARAEAVPIRPLLERAAAEVCLTAGAVVTVVADPELTVSGDPLALERAVSNLCRNGVEAGGAPVAVTARAENGGVEITVQDQGPGIPAEAIPHLFEPFFRVDVARSRDGGTGLGLAIVKAVVDAHGGQIRVESAPGRGTAVVLWLPSCCERLLRKVD